MGRQQCRLRRVGGCVSGGHRLAGWWDVDIKVAHWQVSIVGVAVVREEGVVALR